MMEKIALINELYFNDKKNLTEIAKIVDTSVSYISKILRLNNEYKIEKEKRKQDKLTQRREIQKELIYTSRKNSTKADNIDLKKKHNDDVMELSKHSSIGNQSLKKWCSSAYKYNKNKNRYEFDTDTLLKPNDFPMYIKA